MTQVQKPSEILRAARELISVPERWTQGVYARNSDGVSTDVRSPGAVCFCSVGAVWRVAGPSAARGRAIGHLYGVTDSNGILRLNDSGPHKRIIEAFDAAIALAEKAEVES